MLLTIKIRQLRTAAGGQGHATALQRAEQAVQDLQLTKQLGDMVRSDLG
jgi:hypothetical protein